MFRSWWRAFTEDTRLRRPPSFPALCPATAAMCTRCPTIQRPLRLALAEKGVTDIYMVAYTNPRPYNTATGQTLAEAIQGYWAKVGVNCRIDTFDWTSYIDKCNTGDFDVCLFGWTGDNGDPDNFLNLLASEDIEMNVAQYHDEEFNQPCWQRLLLFPTETRETPLYAEMEQKVADENVWLLISHQENLAAYASNVHNFIFHPTGDRCWRGGSLGSKLTLAIRN